MGIVYEDDNWVSEGFMNWVKAHKGRVFNIELSADKRLIKELKRAV